MATIITAITNGQVKIAQGSATPLYFANQDFTANIDASKGVVYLWDITQNTKSTEFAPEDTTVGGVNYPTLEGLCEVLNASPFFFRASSGGGGGATVCPSTADYQTLVSDGAGGWCISANAFSTPPNGGTHFLFTGSFDLGTGSVLAGAVWSDGADKSMLSWVDIDSEEVVMRYEDGAAGTTIEHFIDGSGTRSSFSDGSNQYLSETTATTAQFKSTEATGNFNFFAGINANGSELRYEDTFTPKEYYIRVTSLLAAMRGTGPGGDYGQVVASEVGANCQFFTGAAESQLAVSDKLSRIQFSDGATVTNYVRVTDKQARAEFANGTETASVTCNGSGVDVSSATQNIILSAIAGYIYSQSSQRVSHRTEVADYTLVLGDYALTANPGVSTITLFATGLSGLCCRIKNITGGDITIAGNGKNVDGAASILLPNTNSVDLIFNETNDQWEVF